MIITHGIYYNTSKGVVTMGLFSKKVDDGIVRTNVIFFDGLDVFIKGKIVELSYCDNEKKVVISSGETKVNLSVDKIYKAKFISETEIQQQSKSIGGRAVVGGLLLGPLGAIVGSASGIGNKAKKEIKNFIVINYNEGSVLTFEIPQTNLNFRKVLQGINANIKATNNIEL